MFGMPVQSYAVKALAPAISLAILAFTAQACQAEEIELCVDSADQLRTALLTAEASPGDYAIKVVAGTYDLSSTALRLNVTTPESSIIVRGNYAPGCASQMSSPDARATTLRNISAFEISAGSDVEVAEMTVETSGENGTPDSSVPARVSLSAPNGLLNVHTFAVYGEGNDRQTLLRLGGSSVDAANILVHSKGEENCGLVIGADATTRLNHATVAIESGLGLCVNAQPEGNVTIANSVFVTKDGDDDIVFLTDVPAAFLYVAAGAWPQTDGLLTMDHFSFGDMYLFRSYEFADLRPSATLLSAPFLGAWQPAGPDVNMPGEAVDIYGVARDSSQEIHRGAIQGLAEAADVIFENAFEL